MDNNSNGKSSKVGLIIAVVVVLLGIGAAVYALNMQPSKTSESTSNSTSNDTSSNNSGQGSSNDDAVSNVGSTVITFTDDGFDKAEYTSKAGEAVMVTNESSMDVQFSSDDHPTHLENTELNLDVLSPGESATFTPAGAGTYKFHDHINDEFTGTLIVE